MRLKQHLQRIRGLTFSIFAFAVSIFSCEYAPHGETKVAEAVALPLYHTGTAITHPPHLKGSTIKKDSAEYSKIHSYDDYPDPILDSLKRAAEKWRKGKLK